MTKRKVELALGVATALTLFSWTSDALAQSTIRSPGARPRYSFEAEPHLLFGAFDPPGFGTGSGVGLGFRGTLDIVPDGFIRPINDSVGIGFGADWVHYSGSHGPRGRCVAYQTAPGGTRVCVEVESTGGDTDYLYLPVVMQWNFWLHRQWSVFAEPGIALHWANFDDFGFDPFILYLGGRFQPTQNIAITARLGYPTFSLGASFFL